MPIAEELSRWLKDARRLVILGIGSPIRRDDSIGLALVNQLKGNVPRSVRLISCETVPESFTREVRQFRPTHVIMIDAALLKLLPGEARLVPLEKIKGLAISTHTLPLNIFAEYVKQTTKAKIILLAIQPKDTSFGTGLTSELEKTSKSLADLLQKVVSKIGEKV